MLNLCILLWNDDPEFFPGVVQFHQLSVRCLLIAESKDAPLPQNGAEWQLAVRKDALPVPRLTPLCHPEINDSCAINLVHVNCAEMSMVGS